MLVGCTTPIDVHSASTPQLLDRRAEIDRNLAEDDPGVPWGMSRWFSHASENHNVIEERQDIDTELARRHVKLPKTAETSSASVPQ
jgi:hypothetical protein